MTNNTIPSVPRELLERVLNAGWGSETVDALDDLRDFLESTPSPAGVDGLEVKRLSIAGVRSLIECSDGELARYSDVERLLAIIDGLRGDVAQLQSMLATVSKAGIRVRTERDQHAQRIGELEGLLREARLMTFVVNSGQSGVLRGQIDAALSAGKDAAP